MFDASDFGVPHRRWLHAHPRLTCRHTAPQAPTCPIEACTRAPTLSVASSSLLGLHGAPRRLFAVSRRFSLQPSCHLAVVPLSSFSPLASAKHDQKLLIESMATFAEIRAEKKEFLATTNFSSLPNGTDIKARREAALVEKKIRDAEYVYKHIEVSECAPTEASEEKADACLALDLSGEKYLRMFENYANATKYSQCPEEMCNCCCVSLADVDTCVTQSQAALKDLVIWDKGEDTSMCGYADDDSDTAATPTPTPTPGGGARRR